MWDRTVKPISLAMRLDSLEDLPKFALPAEYGWRYYRPGDMRRWSEIELSAGEWSEVETGLAKFRQYYPTDDKLDGRMIFLTDNGVPFATATAWFGGADSAEGQLHWVSVDEAHQGRRLSLPLVSLAMHRLRELGHSVATLTTQTESWVAIKVYHRFGFRPVLRTGEELEGWRIVSEKTGIDFMKDVI